jgi:hypothetical protein
MLHDLLVDIKLDKFCCYRNLETTAIESACAEIEVEKLKEILKKYTSADDMFTAKYLHGTNQNIKIMVDMGKAVDAPEMVDDVLEKLMDKEPLCYRCLVEVFKAWVRKTEKVSADAGVSETEGMTVEKEGFQVCREKLEAFLDWKKNVEKSVQVEGPEPVSEAEAMAIEK